MRRSWGPLSSNGTIAAMAAGIPTLIVPNELTVLGQMMQSTAVSSASTITMTVFPMFLFLALSVWWRKQFKLNRGV